MKVSYTNFEKWQEDATALGWVHCHDNITVCDDEDDICIGEFYSESETGWLITE